MTDRKKFNVYILAICLFITALILFVYTEGHQFDDYPWHLKVGEYICENGEMPGEIFSWLPEREGAKTMFHEWLSGVILYSLNAAGDTDGSFYVGACTLIFFVVLLFGNGDYLYKSKNLLAPILLTAVTSVGFFAIVDARPHMIGLILFAVTLTALRRFNENENSRLIYLLPIITILWANTHGGTVIFAVLLPLGYLLCGFFDVSFGRLYFEKKTKRQLITFASAAAANLLAGLVNPYGAELYLFSFVYNNDVCKKYIVEWQRGTLTSGFAVIGLIILGLVVLFTKKRINVKDIGLSAAFLLLGLIYMRFGAWASIVVAEFCVLYLFNGEEKENKQKTMPFVALFCVLTVVFCGLTINAKKASKTPSDLMSKEMYSAIAEIAPNRIYNGYGDGGVLVYNGYRDFIDSRAEASADIIEDVIKFSNCALPLEEMEAFVERFDFDAFFVAKDERVNLYLRLRDDCELVYADETHILYKRTE